MSRPNIFDYATKELSQDAVICLLIKYSGYKGTEGTAERRLGTKFVKALIGKHKEEGYELDNIDKVEVYRQDNHIDVLAHINDNHVLLIEDKLGPSPYYDVLVAQLNKYWEAVVIEGNSTNLRRDISEDKVSAIFLNTGNISNGQKRYVEEQTEFKVFSRKDFLEVLNSYHDYQGANSLIIDFRHHLERLEERTNSFKEKHKNKSQDWEETSWQGLFMKLEKMLEERTSCSGDWDWGDVNNPSTPFVGFWWHFCEVKVQGQDVPYSLYLQIEAYSDTNNPALCFKINQRN